MSLAFAGGIPIRFLKCRAFAVVLFVVHIVEQAIGPVL